MMMKPPIFGTKKLVFQKNESNVVTWQITSGLWEFLDHVVPVRRFITIVVLPMGQKVDRLQMKIDI